MTFNLPTALTWLRIVLIPVFVGVYYLPDSLLSMTAKNWIAMTIFAVAAITDWADGYLARRWGQTSAFGAFLDPVADKLIVAAALITAIIALLLDQPLIPYIDTKALGTVALWVAAILTLWSMVHYLRLAAPHIRRGEDPHTIRGDE